MLSLRSILSPSNDLFLRAKMLRKLSMTGEFFGSYPLFVAQHSLRLYRVLITRKNGRHILSLFFVK
jgi:hypothetical protein